MGYNLKLVRTQEDGTKEEHAQPWCQSYAVYQHLPGSQIVERGDASPGVRIELTHANRIVSEISISEEGESIYVESDLTGKTISSFHWPPRTKQQEKEFRS